MTRRSGIDIDDIHAQLLAGPGSTAADLGFALVAEVRLLREQVDGYRMMIDGLENAAHEERAAVVAYLHKRANLWLNAEKCQRTEASMGVWIACGAIERGEHRREEGA